MNKLCLSVKRKFIIDFFTLAFRDGFKQSITNREELSGTKFSFPGIAKSFKILGISRGWTMIFAFNWTIMKNTGHY